VRRGTAQARARTAEPVLSQLLHDLPTRRRAELIDAIKDLHRALAASARDHRKSS
jgi:hypothetical protein